MWETPDLDCTPFLLKHFYFIPDGFPVWPSLFFGNPTCAGLTQSGKLWLTREEYLYLWEITLSDILGGRYLITVVALNLGHLCYPCEKAVFVASSEVDCKECGFTSKAVITRLTREEAQRWSMFSFVVKDLIACLCLRNKICTSLITKNKFAIFN